MTAPTATRRAVPLLPALVLLLLPVCAAAAPDARVADAAKRRDRAAVAALLKQGADVNGPQGDRATALLWAAHWNDLDMVTLLLRSGARVDAANDFGATPLLVACSDAGAPVVEALLRAGAAPGKAMPSGETPLMVAARTGHRDVAALLLDKGADVNAREATHNQTALMWAFSRKHLDVARLLVERGADIRARTDLGFSPLMFAARTGDVDAVRLLLDRGADLRETSSDGSSVLLVAVVRGHVPLATFLLERGADPNAKVPGYTPLHWAAGVWESQTTHEYVTQMPQPAEWLDEWSAMIGLQGERKTEMIKALVAHGADVNARLDKFPPRFGYSFANGSPTGGSMIGGTAMFLAALGADLPTLRLLLALGADPQIRTADGSTPLMAAAGMSAVEEEHGISDERHVEAVKLLLSYGVDVNAANDKGNTALHATAFMGLPKVAEYLVTGGRADVNPLNRNSETPLRVAEGTIIIAMFFIHEKVAVVLRAHGGTSNGAGVCTDAILRAASVNGKSTVCETGAGQKNAPAPATAPPR